jgi:hypothetical protein
VNANAALAAESAEKNGKSKRTSRHRWQGLIKERESFFFLARLK